MSREIGLLADGQTCCSRVSAWPPSEGVQGSGLPVFRAGSGRARRRGELCGVITRNLGSHEKRAPRFAAGAGFRLETDGYLVDPASSHMLVLKAKPCMSKFKQFKRETANGSLIQS